MGKPTTYSPELAEFILEGLWEGKTITQLARENSAIKRRTVSDWRKNHPGFDQQYREAMTGGAEALLDESLDVVDDRVSDPDASSRRARAWARHEVAKRKAPQLYGDRVTLSGDPEAPLSGLSNAELDAAIAERMAKLRGGAEGGNDG